MSQPAATTPAGLTGQRRSRWLCALLLLATFGGVVWWQMAAPLNWEERRMVGRWNYMVGPRATWIEFQSDRTVLNDPTLSPPDSYRRVWSVEEGKFAGRIRHRVGDQLQRWVERGSSGVRDMQNDGANGRITWINDDSFQMTWVNPQTNIDGLTVIMTREGALANPDVGASSETPAPSLR